MAVQQVLVMVVMLAVVTCTTTHCQDNHYCKVDLDPHIQLGFLVPEMCCEEVQYPFTFLAHFYNNSDHNITFHLHEYYLLDVEVRLCYSQFYDLYDDYYYPVDDDAVQWYCVDDYPYRCLKESDTVAASVLSYRSYDDSGYLNITIPVKPRPVLQNHSSFLGRPVFNITYERRRLGEPRSIADEGNIANLDMCSFNGYPVLTPDANRENVSMFKCECNDDAEGDKCEWGGGCHPLDLFSVCSGHGECRYYRGSVTCMCDEDHFGYRCEHPVPSYQPLQPSGATGQLMNVTVQLLREHYHHTSTDQATKALKDACITLMDVHYHNDNKKYHFTMNKKQQDFLPNLRHWRTANNLSATINITNRDVTWLGPVSKTVRDGRLMLQCTVFAASFPFNMSWFIGQHQIYNIEVDSCEGLKNDTAIAVEFLEQNHTKCPNDSGCMSGSRPCFTNTSCTIKLVANGYNNDLDWEEFRVLVSHGNTSAHQKLVAVYAKPQPVVMVTPLSASIDKRLEME